VAFPIQYPDLPVSARRDDILDALRNNRVLILCGETGSGKTTQIPKMCLEARLGSEAARSGKLIGCTQPRRIAARSVAARIAQELGGELGGLVGYKVRFTDKVRHDTAIKVMTDGILLAESQGDPLLSRYDTIIIDEAHERSLNIDFLLGYLKTLVHKRSDLRLVITSATIDAERFSRHFDGAPVIEVSGRMYPVEVRYRPLAQEENGREAELELAILHAVDEIAGHGGDILIFLPGEREIRDVAEALRKHHPPGADILPLYSRLSNAEQDRVFKPGGGRRIVLATNVAETSLTVPGIRYVIDPGYARIRRYSVRAKVERLQVEKISRASASQRAGRCGRVASGICIRLYDEEDFNNRPAFTDPEIRRSNLAAVILRMQALGLGEVEDFPFLEAPDPRAISDGFQLLEELGAVDEARTLTPLGKQLAQLPIDPRIARMILAAQQENCLSEALVIASALTVQDPRERPQAAQEAADTAHRRFQDERSDFLGFIKLWRFYNEALVHKKSNRKLVQHCYDNFISAMRMREWRDVHGQLAVMVKEMGMRPNEVEADYGQIHRALLAGLLGNVGLKSEGREYHGTRGLKFSIFPGSVLFKPNPPQSPLVRGEAADSFPDKGRPGGLSPKWLMAAELTETTRLYGRTLARIEPEWIEPLAGHLIKRSYFDPHWEKKAARVSAYERVTLYGLVIEPKRKVHYGPINPSEGREIFIRAALVEGEYFTNAPFFKHNRKLVEDIEELEHKARRQDILVDEQRIFDFYDALIPSGIHNGATFDKWRREAERSNLRLLFLTREQLMRHEAGHITEDLFPPTLQISGGEYPLTYRFEHGHPLDGVTVTIPLAALNQISSARCEWLVPGLLREKFTWFIRALPHKLRSACVPVPEFVTSALGALILGDRILTESLATFVKATKGFDIPQEAWANETLPDHLRMNFRIIDTDNRELASSRDMETLRRELGGQAEQSFGAALTSDFERDGITTWDIGDLPDKVEFQRHGQTLVGYPALVDEDGDVALRLFDTPAKASQAMNTGLARLLLLQLPEQARFLDKTLPVSKEMCLHYLPVGTCDTLKQDLKHAIAAHVLIGDKPPVRNEAQFAQRRDDSRLLLVVAANQTCKLVADILREYHTVAHKLHIAKASPSAISDMKEQLSHLIYPGFLAQTPMTWLRHYPRYLKAMALRLDKLLHAASRDSQLQAELAPFWRRYLDAMLQMEKRGTEPSPELLDYRWMIEELRVSLFAQELKTLQPISTKRLEKQWESTIRQVSQHR